MLSNPSGTRIGVAGLSITGLSVEAIHMVREEEHRLGTKARTVRRVQQELIHLQAHRVASVQLPSHEAEQTRSTVVDLVHRVLLLVVEVASIEQGPHDGDATLRHVLADVVDQVLW